MPRHVVAWRTSSAGSSGCPGVDRGARSPRVDRGERCRRHERARGGARPGDPSPVCWKGFARRWPRWASGTSRCSSKWRTSARRPERPLTLPTAGAPTAGISTESRVTPSNARGHASGQAPSSFGDATRASLTAGPEVLAGGPGLVYICAAEARAFGSHPFRPKDVPFDPESRHHRPRRPRQDHPGGSDAAAGGGLPRQPAGGRAGDGLESARARARDHHPGQEHRRALAGRQDQHRGHAGPRRFRRRGRADSPHGGRGADPGGRGRGPDAADPVRHPEGAGARAPADRRHQQDRPGRRRAAPGARRGARPVHRSRGHPRTARRAFPLYLEPRRHRHDRAGSAGDRPPAACSRPSSTTSRSPRGIPRGRFRCWSRPSTSRASWAASRSGGSSAAGCGWATRCRSCPWASRASSPTRPSSGTGSPGSTPSTASTGSRWTWPARATSWRSRGSRRSRSGRRSPRWTHPSGWPGSRSRSRRSRWTSSSTTARLPAAKGSTSPAASSRTGCTASWSGTWRSGSRRPTAPTPTPSRAAASSTSAS